MSGRIDAVDPGKPQGRWAPSAHDRPQMLISPAVTIIVNGAIVSSAAPAQIAAGRVVAPLTPIVVRLVSRATYDPRSATVALERGGVRIRVPVAFVENEEPYVELGVVVQRLGGTTSFDTQTKTLAIVIGWADPIATPIPFDPGLSRAGPSSVFTPAPAPATPRAVETGLPRPRRTAIPAVPSEPIPLPSQENVPTIPRRPGS